MAKSAAATELLRVGGKGAMEKMLQAFLPEVMSRLDTLSQHVADLRKDMAQQAGDLRKDVAQQVADLRKDVAQQAADLRRDVSQQVAGLRAEVHAEVAGVRSDLTEVRADVNARAERTQELINELGLRVNTVGTRLDTYFDLARRDSAKLDAWLERLVRVEEAQKLRQPRD